MRFGEIIKKAWHITWRYKWLWVLGVFAGLTGPGGGGGGGGGGRSSNFQQSFGSFDGAGASGSNPPDFSQFLSTAERWLPFALVVLVMLVVIGIAFAIVGIGARGGLVWAVNEIEEGRVPRLGQAWDAGFARFWSVFGLGLLLQLPVALAGLGLAALILAPLMGPLLAGREPDPALVLGPLCGTLAIGLPLLIVAGVVLGIMYITGVRFIMLHGMGAVRAAKEGWRAFRARFGDHVIMYLISLGLSIAASFALAVPAVLVAFATALPAGVAFAGREWSAGIALIGVMTVLIMLLSFAFVAVWGTFTSAMWTVFFRRLTGLEALVPVAPPVPAAPVAPPPAPGLPDA